jgi:hypothetical protein
MLFSFSITCTPSGGEIELRANPCPLLSMTMTSKSRQVWFLSDRKQSARIGPAVKVGMATVTQGNVNLKFYAIPRRRRSASEVGNACRM